jgi:hypothetical protein
MSLVSPMMDGFNPTIPTAMHSAWSGQDTEFKLSVSGGGL